MEDPASDLWNTVYATAASLASVTLGVLIRYSHKARRTGTKIDWKRLRYEVPTILGLAIIAGPLSEYVRASFGVNQGVTAATCICCGYLGTRVLDIVGSWLEKPGDKDD